MLWKENGDTVNRSGLNFQNVQEINVRWEAQNVKQRSEFASEIGKFVLRPKLDKHCFPLAVWNTCTFHLKLYWPVVFGE